MIENLNSLRNWKTGEVSLNVIVLTVHHVVDLKNVCWVFFKGSDLYQLTVLDQIFININTKYRYKRTQAAETLFNNF